MNRIYLIVALVMAISLSLTPWVAQGQPTNGLNVRNVPIVDYVPEKPTSPQLVTDAIPRVYVRFDDGRAGQDPNNPVKKQMAAYLRRGLPVAMALNADNIGTAGYMTWEDIRELQDYARSFNTTLHIMQHTNGNFETPFSATHEDIVNELKVDEIVRELAYRPRYIVLPGDAARQEWYRRNREYFQSVADSLGLWFINSIIPTDSTSTTSLNPSQINLDGFGAAESNFILGGSFVQYARPSMGIARNELPSGITDIAGQAVVERIAYTGPSDNAERLVGESIISYGQRHITGVKPPRTSTWTLTGSAAASASGAAFGGTLQYYISTRLAGNYGFVIVGHDSTYGATSSITGVTDGEYQDGGWSHEHVAWVLAMLQKKGHIKVVGPEEWALWVTGEYAPGTDLIANPYCIIPQYDIGDTLGATSEYPWVRGLSVIGTQAGVQPNTTMWIRDLDVEQTGNVAKYDRTALNNPYDLIGVSVSGVRGRSGSITLNGSTGPAIIRIGQGNLKPGRYRFSMSMFNSNDPTIGDFHIAQKIKGYKLNASAEAGYAPAYNDTLLQYMWQDENVVLDFSGATELNTWGDFFIPFEFPKTYLGDLGGASDGLSLLGRSDESNAAAGFPAIIADSVREFIPLVNSARWGFTLQITASATTNISNPRLIYLGD